MNVFASQVAVTTFRRFHQAAITIDPSSRDLEKSEEIRIQYREFLRRLEKYGRDSNIQKSGEFRSLTILGDFLDPSNKLYENVELFLGVLAKAAVCQWNLL